MKDDADKMSCADFQAQLPELIGGGGDASAHPHVTTCGDCRKFLADLETIAEAARQLFPSVEPRDELWKNIESAIKKEGDGDPEGGPTPKLAPQP